MPEEKSNEYLPAIEFDADGKVKRRFTKEWRDSGSVDKDEVWKSVRAIIKQHRVMVEYIELLHDKIDELLKNKC